MAINKDFEYYVSLPYRIVLHPDPTGGFAVEIPDLPGCLSQGDTVEDAYHMIEDAKHAWIEVALEDGLSIPDPSRHLASEYSGKFNVRVPRSLHKLLVEKAAEEDVSLNQYILYKLSSAVGLQQQGTPSLSSEESAR